MPALFLLLQNWRFVGTPIVVPCFCTRESLASNTSSIVESNRRQNPTWSPAHGGAGPAFSFRASTDPPTNEAEKLQKPSNCLQASVTSV
ncbi:hypothetical protein MJG53_018873 [Ovis ammon polii x Ovis aries]|uniref:Uncharacterized protein n=2 Tax=Ovis TaxID=9935 RepID=A0A836CQY9_SHEEP|nr:hypothetical protein JEQ12_013146 [Ovis aries]KAI4556919.1 hypothetical protein MJG53_018873 [Ovis ammon polii x Ovis aries]